MIAMLQPTESWVARWQRVNEARFTPGLYAVSVSGVPPEYAIDEQEREHGKYIDRDKA